MDNINLDNHDIFSSIHEPYWIASTEKPSYPALKENINVDVAIIGGGIAGITSAFLLKKKGLKVAILEANKITQGTSGHTTAKITSQHNLIYSKINKSMGHENAQQYAEANESAIHFIADLIKEKSIDCDFEWRPAYVYTKTEDYIEKIEEEIEIASSLGIKALYRDSLPLPFKVKAAVRFDNQAQFHPLKYLLALAKEIPGEGSFIFENTKVIDVEDKETCMVITEGGNKVAAPKVIVASHFPCFDGLGLYFARMYLEKSYVIAAKIGEKFPEGMFISAEDPGRSLRSQKFQDGEMVLVGGEHHKTGSEKNTNVHYENLCTFAKSSYDVKSLLFRWSTQDCMTADGIPYTGYLTSRTSNVLVATGFGKWGMTNSTASAIILTDLITTGKSNWSTVYNPSRGNFPAAAPNLISQNFDVAVKLVGGKIAPAPSSIEIKNGEAEIVNIDGERYGAYRDSQGKLHIVDITCTHLGCELVWNEAETTWDCPCHGSRFNIDGDNVEGPAFLSLKHPSEGPNKKDPNIL
jgi:glycine/D-amino acid oxidase-like deaminating enzyme/nitrite reductase/ring-hydroxylating ferredoxin subunit